MRSRICRRIGAALKAREALDGFGAKDPRLSCAVFGDRADRLGEQPRSIRSRGLVTPQVLPFALSLVMQRLAASVADHPAWPSSIAASDDEIRVAATQLRRRRDHGDPRSQHGSPATLRSEIKRGNFNSVAGHLQDRCMTAFAGLRTELDLRNDSIWGRQLASIRVDISSTLQSEIDSVPGRVRRLLRQRS